MNAMFFATCRAGLAAWLIVAAVACNQGSEGDRCNPVRAADGHDECASGLECKAPQDCPESYCCSPDGKSSSPFCQPGCHGGAAAACNAGDVDACARACSTDEADLASPSTQCEAGVAEAGPDAPVDGH